MEDLIAEHGDILPQESAVKEKRSVHTKFKLSEEAIEAREQLADYWDVTQKEVAEEVAKITDRFISGEGREDFVQNASNRRGELTRKTHVVSKATKDFLERSARKLNLTRDQFFDASLRLAYTLVQQKRVQKRQKKQIKYHKHLLPVLRDLRDHTDEVYTKIEKLTDDDDPLRGTTIFGKLRHLENIVDALEEEIRRGKPLVSDFDFWSIPSDKNFIEGKFRNRKSTRGLKGEISGSDSVEGGPLRLDPNSPPNLTHARIQKAVLGGREIDNPSWNKLLKTVHKKAIEDVGSFLEVYHKVTKSNIKKGEFDEKGFHPVETEEGSTNFSIQGKKAQTAWPDILHIVKYLGTDIFVRIRWNDKEDAVHPGKTGVLQWAGSQE